MTPYGNIDLGHHGLKPLPEPMLANQSMEFCGIHHRIILHELLKISICKMSLKKYTCTCKIICTSLRDQWVHGITGIVITWFSIKLYCYNTAMHDGLMTWELFLHYWPVVRGIQESLVVPSQRASYGCSSIVAWYVRIKYCSWYSHYIFGWLMIMLLSTWVDILNTIPADDLAPCVARSSGGMVLSMLTQVNVLKELLYSAQK